MDPTGRRDPHARGTRHPALRGQRPPAPPHCACPLGPGNRRQGQCTDQSDQVAEVLVANSSSCPRMGTPTATKVTLTWRSRNASRAGGQSPHASCGSQD